MTRIEGHAKITLHLDEQGEVADARFHVTQFRGFEKLCEGRPFTEMPSLMARICGICPVSHLIASAKACDALLAVRIPPTADKLRRIFNMAQIVQSHALSVFHLSSPDLLLGMDADPAKSNLWGVYERDPQLARDGIRLRQFGQQIIERLGGKRIHPAWVVPGGVSEPLSQENRDEILAAIPEALKIAVRTLSWFKKISEGFREEIGSFGNFPSLFMGSVKEDGSITFYDGKIRVGDASGNLVADNLAAEHYADFLGEKSRALELSEVSLLQTEGISRGHLPGRASGASECCGSMRNRARRSGTGGVQGIAACRRPKFISLPSGSADRNSVLRRTPATTAERPGNTV